jgi:hypothetical protein
MGKTLLQGLPGDLLWRRFSPLRSAMIPLRSLEPYRKNKKENEKRKELLKKNGINYCALLSLWGIALEIALLVGEIIFFILMAEIIRKDLITFTDDFILKAEVYIFAAWCFNYMLVETLYVCMGFSLYINSRIEVEGWDIELIFRGFAEKLKKKSVAAAVTACIIVGLFLPAAVSASDYEQTSGGSVPLESLQIILDSPEFGGETDTWSIRLKNPPEEREYNFNPLLEKLRQIFANVLRFLLISIITALVVFLFIFARKFKYTKKSTSKKYSMTTLHGIPAENPQKLLEKAVDYFRQDNLRMAWGYCTAAVILSWQMYRGIIFPPNATENDCANMVVLSPLCSIEEKHVFSLLIKNWINLAYAGRLPSAGSFEEAVELCKSLRNANG